jgi:hypothetical protein
MVKEVEMATRTRNTPALDIDESLPLQERSWRIRNAAWLAMVLVLGAGVTGLFGRGPLAAAEVTVGPGVTLEYDRWARKRAPLLLRFRAATSPGDTLRIHVGWPLIRSVRVLDIEPHPEGSAADPAGVEYRFSLQPPAGVDFLIQPESAGRLRFSIRAGSAAPVPLTLLIWP